MANPLELNISGRKIVQIGFYSGVHYVLPAQSTPPIVLSGDVGFPIVDIKKKFGPYFMDHLTNAEFPESIEEIVSQEIEKRLRDNKELENVNGFFPFSSRRTKATWPGAKGIIGQRERERMDYFLMEYSLTDKVLLMTLARGKMYGDNVKSG